MGKHYVPQEYLRGFSSDRDRKMVWMFDKLARDWKEVSIKQVAQQAEYFPPDVETRLNELIEQPANLALQALRRGELPAERSGGDLLSYIAVMIMRVPRKRTQAKSILSDAIGPVLESARSELSELIAPETEAKVQDLLKELDRLEAKYRVEGAELLKDQIESPWPSEEVLRGIHEMCWRLVLVPDDVRLVTSDNPAFYFSAFGIGSPQSELTFPLSTQLALLGSRQGPAGEVIQVRVNRRWAREINRRIIVGATRFVFAPRMLSWVATVAERSEPDLNRFDWTS